MVRSNEKVSEIVMGGEKVIFCGEKVIFCGEKWVVF